MHTSSSEGRPDQENEHEWVMAAQQGDGEAFSRIVRQYQDRIFNMLYRLMGNMDDAGDLTQETFLKAYKGIATFEGKARLSTWITRIAVNASRDFLRKKKVRKHLNATLQPNEDGNDPYDAIAGDFPDPAHEASNREMHARLHEAISQLDETYRAVLVLRDIQGHNYEQISEITGLPRGTVKSRLFRARELLRGRL